ncbi:MAG: MBL fold metallo-hydrolase [Proteobacteria bacterium]|nr:MBL fold metallo-hydrolase [Pseudomonadota bacterium]
MIFNKTGLVKDNLYVTGFPWSPVYLLVSEHPVIFEAGFCCMGRHYEKDIIEILHERKPEMLFITHVHYDHCGAASYLKKVFEGLKIGASGRASEIIQRPNAQALMVNLSENVIKLIENMDDVNNDILVRDQFEPFHVDTLLEDGQIIDFKNGLSVHVFASPGHTRDMLSYYIPEKKFLIATETAGCMSHTGAIVTEFLVDYDAYITSLRRLAELEVDVLCQGHHFVFTGSDVKKHFEKSIISAEKFRETVEDFLRLEDGSVERVVSLIKAQEYDLNPGPKQPEGAYMLNLRKRVAHLAERLEAKRHGDNLS